MSFLHRLKSELESEQNRQGMRAKVMVPTKELRELIDHFESVDAAMRLHESEKQDISDYYKLDLLLEKMFFANGKRSEPILQGMLSTLGRLAKESADAKRIDSHFG